MRNFIYASPILKKWTVLPIVNALFYPFPFSQKTYESSPKREEWCWTWIKHHMFLKFCVHNYLPFMMKKSPDLFQILVYYVKFPVYCGTTQKFTSASLHYLQEIKKSMWSIYWILMFIFYDFWKKIYQNCIKWRNCHHVDLLCHRPLLALNTCKLNLLNCYLILVSRTLFSKVNSS